MNRKRYVIPDEAILAALRLRSSSMTYVIRNIVAREHGHDLPTSAVLARLKRMEREGKVRRTSTSYVVQICWAINP